MHALLVHVELDPARDDAPEFLRDRVIPMISQGAGFKSGIWVRSLDGTAGRSLILYESEDAAKDAADRAAQGVPGAPATFVSAEVLEVVAQA